MYFQYLKKSLFFGKYWKVPLYLLVKWEVVSPNSRSVDELTTFYILRWVNNVFHILLKIWHIIVWFGPNYSGKSTPSFRIYDMIKKYAEMSFSPCVYNRKNVHYVAHGIIWTWPPVVVMFTCCFILYRCWCNVWWCVTHRHPSKQCPAYLSTNIVLTAGYATHVWNYIELYKNTRPIYKFEEAFNLVSKGFACERISRILYIYIYCL